MPQEIAVVAVAQAKPGCEAKLEAAIRLCIPETRKEAGCRLYTVHQDLEHAGRFVFIERWDSREALDAHVKEAHFQAMVKGFEGNLQGELEVSVLRELS